MATSKPKVLFLAEGATLAHVARPLLLASHLDRDGFDVTIARPSAFAWLTANASLRTVDLWCQDARTFAQRLDRGQPLYDLPTLLRYVEDDLAILDGEKPDVVVGDFRLSLSVSARLRSVPYITICDAYWSPECTLAAPLPVLPFTRFTPIPVAEFLFRHISPIAFRLHAIPMKRLHQRYGLPSLGYDLRRAYTEADLRLFANFPALFPEVQANGQAKFIGPLAWSPPAMNLDFIGADEPLIYVTMGSSGNVGVLATLIPLLERKGIPVVVATAGKPLPHGLASKSVKIFDYLPGDQVCKRARLVVCNGGSPTTNQALMNGVPVLGIPQNMDQFLNMSAIERFGSGLLVRADRANETSLMSAIDALLSKPRFKERALQLAESVRIDDSALALAEHIAGLLPRRNHVAI